MDKDTEAAKLLDTAKRILHTELDQFWYSRGKYPKLSKEIIAEVKSIVSKVELLLKT